ncbi:MAG TPA: AAA family ATPase, partial [Bacteroidales bacterium]|nr:AAA family ATPase [Bacteroidales bacterium]
MSADYKQVLFEQKEELYLKKSETLIHRDKMSEINIDSNLAQIITGIRRSGKSTIATMMLNGKRYGFINFDDERLYNLEAKELNTLLESVYSVYGEIDYL